MMPCIEELAKAMVAAILRYELVSYQCWVHLKRKSLPYLRGAGYF